MKIKPEKIKAYALENAIKYEGRANPPAVLSGLFAEGLEKSEIKDIMPLIREVVSEVNSLSLIEQKDAFKALKNSVSKRVVRTGLPELPNAVKGEVVMRFAPFPSGPLHIGNTRQLILNDEYCKLYNGKLLLVIDDTIGSEQKPIEKEAYRLIEEGAKWLGINYNPKIIKKSSRMSIYYSYAEEMIQKGYMYICNCPREELAENKKKGVECSCRQFSSEEQLQRWSSMFLAPEGSMCVRLKTNMQDPDPAFRDRIMFRISDRPHAISKNKYRVYPLLDFSWAIDDHLLGVTHILRGMDLVMETRVEKFIWDIFGWQHPEVLHTGFFAIEGVKLSKSKGAEEVKSKTYIGWNDPRTWSLQSLKDRGIKPESIREFVLSLGLKKTNITTPIDVLYTINKKHYELVSRFFFVEDPQKIQIAGCPEIQASIPYHPNRTKGFKQYQTSGEFYLSRKDLESMTSGNYRLMHLLNFKVDDLGKIRQRNFSFISTSPAPDLKPTYLHWLPTNIGNIEIIVRMPNGNVLEGIGEPKLKEVKEGEIVQFERFGFVKLHRIKKDKLEFWFTHR